MKRLFRLSDGRPDPTRDVDDEIRFHLEMRTREFIEQGLSAEDARRAATESFGDVHTIEAECRRVRMRRARERAWRDQLRWFGLDITFALRSLRKNPAFTIAAVLTLALGIGANTAMFSVVNGVLLQPLPYRDPGRLVSLDLRGFAYWGTYVQFAERARTVEVAAYSGEELSLTGYGDPIRLRGAAVSSNFFSLLGVDAAVGRTFLPDANESGHGSVVVLSDGLWNARFGGDPAIVGREIDLDGVGYTVVGVMPPSVRFPNTTAQLWVPRTIDTGNRNDLWGRGASLIARLRPGADLAQARTEVAALAPQMHDLFPWGMPADFGRGATAIPLRTQIVGNVRPNQPRERCTIPA